MHISSFSSHTNHWNIKNLLLGPQNLLVGKNAGGKSNTLKELWYFLKEILFRDENSTNGEWEISFYSYDDEADIEDTLVYNINIDKNKRKIEYENNNDWVNSPHPITTNRDKTFVSKVKAIRFANTEPGKAAIRLFEQEITISSIAQSLSKVYLQKVVEYMNQIGYSIEKNYFEESTQKIFITEKGTDGLLAVEKMSQGMFRAFALLMYLAYLIDRNEISLLLIDDFCEGLDYERATKLGKLVFDICKKNDIQLIATTNDSFLMDTIDISCWNLLQRNGENITTINSRSQPALFKKFPLSGLSNFDFFSSDYIARHLQKEKA